MACARPTRRLKPFGQRLDGLLQHRFEFGHGGGIGGALLGFAAFEAAHLGDEGEELARRHVAIGGRAFGQIAETCLRARCVSVSTSWPQIETRPEVGVR